MKNSLIKLLDFWAPWCVDQNTPILTENGYVQASKIQVGQKLVAIDPQTKEQSIKKVRKIKIFKDVPSKRIVLETGRELIGDNNHLVLTQGGFKKLQELRSDEKILTDPTQDNPVFGSKSNQVILSTTSNNFADKVLIQLGLLPIKANNSQLPILAKLLGFVITDGYLYEDLKHNIYETHFFVGLEEDAQAIKADLKTLGFDKLEIKRQIKDRTDGNRKYTINCLRCRNLNRAVFFLLKTLGSPVGRKKNQAYFIPDWIMDGNREIKRSFLSGWLGGDGCKISYHVKHGGTSSHDAGFNINAIEFHKEKDLEKEGILYARQLGLLLEELGVEVREVSSSNDEDGVIISLRVATDYVSILNLTKIGYSYAKTKNSEVPFIGEFLQYRLFERNQYVQLKQVVLQQLALGISNQLIAQSLQIPVNTVVSWKYNQSATVTHVPENGEARFDKWLEIRQQGEFLWEKIRLIEDINVQDVVGITIDSPHTIVTNGFVSHNCGPCQMMKPVIEALEKELKDKVEFVKINVDEDQETASKYGVMGIPTFVIEKDGKEIARKTGFTSKEELLKLISA